MLDAQLVDTDDAAFQTATEQRSTQRVFEVWLCWDDDLSELHRRAKPEAVREQFTMVRARPCDAIGGTWRCSFAHTGRSIDMDRQTVALLRRLTTIAPWAKAERNDAPLMSHMETVHEYEWDAFAKRALP